MKRFSTNRNNWLAIIWIAFPLCLMAAMIWRIEEFWAKPYLFVMWIQLGVPLWLYFDNSYKIDEEFFYYRIGYNKGKIPIRSIREISESKIIRQGQQNAGIASHGLSILYNKFDEIYITPKNERELIELLLATNPDIKVSEKSQKLKEISN